MRIKWLLPKHLHNDERAMINLIRYNFGKVNGRDWHPDYVAAMEAESEATARTYLDNVVDDAVDVALEKLHKSPFDILASWHLYIDYELVY